MFTDPSIDKIFDKLGGKFCVTSLIQKRLKGLAAGDPIAITIPEGENYTLVEIVFEELLQGKIELDFADVSSEEEK